MKPHRVHTICVLAGITALTALAYSPALTGNFVNWDDPEYVVNNYSIRSLAPENIITFFSKPYVGHYVPLVLLSYALEYRLCGLDPRVYHATNILLHIVDSLLVFMLIQTLSGRRSLAYATAALFAIHPIHVESVAWVTERKDVLGALFYLLSLLAWCVFSRRRGEEPRRGALRSMLPRDGFYWAALVFFLCSLLCKAMAVSLPAVLLLIDWFFRSGDRKVDEGGHAIATLGGAVWNKIPFLALSAIFGAVVWAVSESTGAMRPAFYRELLPHLMVAARNLLWYAAQMLFPFRLSAYYPYPAPFHPFSPGMLCCLSLVGFALMLLFRGRRNREIVFGALWYPLVLFPVLQFIPVGNAIAADRYAYLPSIGLFLIAGVFVERLCARGERGTAFVRRRGAQVAFLTILICLALITMRRCIVWGDSEALWSDVISKYPSVPTAYLNMGEALLGDGRLDEAIEMFGRSAELEPDQVSVYTNLGDAYRRKGLMDEAEKALLRARALNPGDAVARNNLGLVYVGQSLPLKARAEFEKAVSLKADYAEPHNNLGILFRMNGDTGRAVREFRAAIAIDSLFRDAYHNLAVTMEQRGNSEEAISMYRRAIGLKPDFAPAHNDLGLLYARIGMLPDAMAEFERTVRLDPGFAQAYYNLALCWHLKGDRARAATNLRKAVMRGYKEVSPDMRGYLEKTAVGQ